MTADTAKEYGELTGLVQAAGIIVSASVAISATWRRRAKWEPSEQDLPNAAQRVSGLVTAVLTALLWTQLNNNASTPTLRSIALWSTGLTLGFAVLYGFLVRTQTFVVDMSTPQQKKSKVIIGGFWLTPSAKKLTKKNTVQKIFAGAAYDPDEVWPRSAVAAAQQAFTVGYIGLTVCGTAALTAAAMLFLLYQQRPRM